MHVLVATDGSLKPVKTAIIAANLAGDDGKVTLLTVVEVPRAMLAAMRKAAADSSNPMSADTNPEFRRTQAVDSSPTRWVGDDAVVKRYVDDTVKARTEGLAAELTKIGVEFSVVGMEGESAARSILEVVTTHGVDVLCIGTHGLGRFEGLLGSASTKIARMAPCSVVLVR